ncbi:hypothetical protein [Candidatus Thiodiazotropha sp. CDECU1]|uniref:hypothetical protein n=1 Tax=Candidatus Thiodiazotropha sp. CDECU1 TaxID=3065865 RepID=UPI00292EA4D8|nr:hypothetical protein [Candidatus Thiodiazotropha sp. CDECU1]
MKNLDDNLHPTHLDDIEPGLKRYGIMDARQMDNIDYAVSVGCASYAIKLANEQNT